MNNLNSKTTRSVAAVALLAGSFFATNASAAPASTSCEVTNQVRNCVSPKQLNLAYKGYPKNFTLRAFVNAYHPFEGPSATIRVFRVKSNATVFTRGLGGQAYFYEKLSVTDQAHVKVEIRDFSPSDPKDKAQAYILTN